MTSRAGHAGLRLHLLRHADAGNPDAWAGDDAARPLSEKGERQAERLGRHLAAIGFDPDAIVSSPKVRALRTAELVASAVGGTVRIDERLGRSFGLRELVAVVEDAGDPRRPVLVGHDPDFSDLLSALVGAPVEMRKGAIARVDLPDGDVGPGVGKLRWLLPPEVLPKS